MRSAREARSFPIPRRYTTVLGLRHLLAIFCVGNNAVLISFGRWSAKPFIVPTRGMSPTILQESASFVDRLWYSRDRFQRGDVVVFRSEGPRFPLFVQRIADFPGDELEIRRNVCRQRDRPWDDHTPFSKPDLCRLSGRMIDYGPVKVPANSYFLLGDNRRLSKDSRMIGPIPMSDLYGVARFIYWSRERHISES